MGNTPGITISDSNLQEPGGFANAKPTAAQAATASGSLGVTSGGADRVTSRTTKRPRSKHVVASPQLSDAARRMISSVLPRTRSVIAAHHGGSGSRMKSFDFADADGKLSQTASVTRSQGPKRAAASQSSSGAQLKPITSQSETSSSQTALDSDTS